MQKPAVLVIAGSDSAGLAGIQADNRALQALGVHGINIVSAVTAQNNRSVLSINPVSIKQFQDQWSAAQDFSFDFIKIGLLASEEQIDFLLTNLKAQHKVIWDPVIQASSGGSLAEGNIASLLQKQRQMLSHCHLVTPNLSEASMLVSNNKEPGSNTADSLASKLLAQGAQSALVTGGRQAGEAVTARNLSHDCNDYLATKRWYHDAIKSSGFWISSPQLDTPNARGTGCILSASIAGCLAKGYSIEDSVIISKSIINRGLTQSFSLAPEQAGAPETASCHFKGIPAQKDYLPALVFEEDHHAITDQNFPITTLPDGQRKPIGLYPVVDRASWLQRLLPLGVSTIQLRVKDLPENELRQEIQTAVEISQQYNARLFINDHWRLAAKYGAYGTHLGQQDLDAIMRNTDQLNALRASGLRLGVSTHCHYEVARILALKPSYIACGPIFNTTSKAMPWIPQGIETLRYWRACLNDYPLVAIGGINSERIGSIIETGVDGIAMISAITEADNPEQATQLLLEKFDSQ